MYYLVFMEHSLFAMFALMYIHYVSSILSCDIIKKCGKIFKRNNSIRCCFPCCFKSRGVETNEESGVLNSIIFDPEEEGTNDLTESLLPTS